jgi:hypothetical protein
MKFKQQLCKLIPGNHRRRKPGLFHVFANYTAQFQHGNL